MIGRLTAPCLVQFGLLACGNAEPDSICAKDVAQAIVGGDPVEQYLSLSPSEQNALVSVQFDHDVNSVSLPCSGVLIHPRWVLTAKHCVPGDGAAKARVRFGAEAHMPELAVSGLVEAAAPGELDAVLIHLEKTIPPTVASPLRVASLPPASLIDARVLLGGYGITEENTVGERRFVTERITSGSDVGITVDGHGLTGACSGDSGAPILWRERSVVVVGILSYGDADCRGEDHYVSVSALRTWLGNTVPFEHGYERLSCGAVSRQGACFRSGSVEQAVWCEGGELQGGVCEADLVCGWHAPSAGFRCIEPEVDPCEGVTQLGICRGEISVHCQEGRLVEQTCSPCRTCGIGPLTGVAGCQHAAEPLDL